MKLSYQWLKELVDFDFDPDVLAEKLTMAGLEAEGVFHQKGMYEKIVVGKILTITKHPQADNLSLCSVDTGREKLNIICAARNITEGIKVPVAPLQTKLPTGMMIEKKEIRGVSSEGMICSAMELALEEDSEGIMVLPDDVAVGEDIATALGLDDAVIDIDLTPNRPDCLSMVGVAREIASIAGCEVKLPEFTLNEEGDDIKKETSVTIEDPDLCPRYAARVIKGVDIKPSPLWLQRRLRALGLRPINNIVDVTNYVLMELGHPLHAFDYDLLKENRIVVRRARDNEEIVTLDDVQRKLDNEMLVIADAKRPVAVAGVMGGINTLVTEKTGNILLESAYFQPVSIRRTSKRLKLHTEASHRFERGADPEGVIQAMNRAAFLFREVAGGKIARGNIDEYPKPIESIEVTLRTKRVNRVLGTELKDETVDHYLRRLGLMTAKVKKDEFKVDVPSFRRDLTREIDLIEEVARIHGYDNIKTTLPQAKLCFQEKNHSRIVEKDVRSIMLDCGFYEAINYSFINEADLDSLRLKEGRESRQFTRLMNPISKEAGIMRTTLIPGLLRNTSLNNHQSIYNLKIFEIGKVFLSKKTSDGLPDERRYVSGVISGSPEGNSWYSNKEKCDFFDIKGVVEILLERLNITGKEIYPFDVEYLYPSRSMGISISGERVGVFGQVSPDILESFDIRDDTYAFEIELEKLIVSSTREKEFKPLPKHPFLLRDIAIIVDAAISSETVLRVIKDTDDNILKEVSLFDVYEGKPIPKGKKSLAYSLTYRAGDRTLTDNEVEVVHSRIIERLKESIGAQLR
jgi:phenylalanyl-tRNA synthetase beta chain